jgi:hypothetical protein
MSSDKEALGIKAMLQQRKIPGKPPEFKKPKINFKH